VLLIGGNFGPECSDLSLGSRKSEAAQGLMVFIPKKSAGKSFYLLEK